MRQSFSLACVALVALSACASKSDPVPPEHTDEQTSVVPSPSGSSSKVAQIAIERPDAGRVDANASSTFADLTTALAALRAQGLGRAADIIDARVHQTQPKMQLTRVQGLAACRHVSTHVGRSTPLRRLHDSMPHTTVELTRAIEERGVPADEVERIARYLSHLVDELAFANLRRFDINHSHVTGRDWQDIDYAGENMTWQGQKAYWSKRGVRDFKRAVHIHAYMKRAFKMRHFARVYQPTRGFDGVRAPNDGTSRRHRSDGGR